MVSYMSEEGREGRERMKRERKRQHYRLYTCVIHVVRRNTGNVVGGQQNKEEISTHQ